VLRVEDTLIGAAEDHRLLSLLYSRAKSHTL
jgi:hypothetical protein